MNKINSVGVVLFSKRSPHPGLSSLLTTSGFAARSPSRFAALATEDDSCSSSVSSPWGLAAAFFPCSAMVLKKKEKKKRKKEGEKEKKKGKKITKIT